MAQFGVSRHTANTLKRNAYTQLHKLSTEQIIVIFSPNTEQHPKQHHRNIPVSSHKLEKGIF